MRESRPVGATSRVQTGLVAGAGAGVLALGVGTGAWQGGSAGAGLGAALGLVGGLVAAGLVHSTAETITAAARGRAGRISLALGTGLGSVGLLIVGLALGARLGGPVAAALGGFTGLTAGLTAALFTNFLAETVVDHATVGRGAGRLLGLGAGGVIGTLLGARQGTAVAVAGGILALPASAILLEIGSRLRAQRPGHTIHPDPRRRPAAFPARTADSPAGHVPRRPAGEPAADRGREPHPGHAG